jgi:hypothetical protein
MRRRPDRFDVSKVEKPGSGTDGGCRSQVHSMGPESATPTDSGRGFCGQWSTPKGRDFIHVSVGQLILLLDQSVGKQQNHTGPAGCKQGDANCTNARGSALAGERLLAWLSPNARAGTKVQK